MRNWESYFAAEERANVPTDDELTGMLDPYGKLEYVVSFGDEEEDDGDWMVCFDYLVHLDIDGDIRVAYCAVVNSDSGGFIETAEAGVSDEESWPRNLPEKWADIGLEAAADLELMTNLDEVTQRWANDIRESIATMKRRTS